MALPSDIDLIVARVRSHRSMRLVQFELGGAVHCGVELQGCVGTHQVQRVSAGGFCTNLYAVVLRREVVDLTAANIATDTLALAKMGDVGLMAAAAVCRMALYRKSCSAFS